MIYNQLKLSENFPYKKLTKIKEEPTYQTINSITQELYENDSSVPSTIGCGNHGHVLLIMKEYIYKTHLQIILLSQKIMNINSLPRGKITKIIQKKMFNINGKTILPSTKLLHKWNKT